MEKFNANLKYAAGYVQEITGSLLRHPQMQAEGVAKQAQADSEYHAAVNHQKHSTFVDENDKDQDELGYDSNMRMNRSID
ncbi:hypothetical protein K493DRAFT_316973 [Basidiobolus meristosporus CBS 931.73]|uniref:Uncharacterized protein n=1 Tax=Basidiobolus meristosporus CBS 931.73 TaxID=1314790 RepID=A0A1Y1Y1Q2_9FUNG|nr:hypothetical protein K493DRAFT_316973 [Basidiobolus meristosporus CBS 931.73]|eukprot:ORX91927.1 hypothetical protein K493DRAFT_316973 [Basidiobolus meristosporus CBS 931.73]